MRTIDRRCRPSLIQTYKLDIHQYQNISYFYFSFINTYSILLSDTRALKHEYAINTNFHWQIDRHCGYEVNSSFHQNIATIRINAQFFRLPCVAL